MWQKFMAWWIEFFHRFFYTRKAHDAVCEAINNTYNAALDEADASLKAVRTEMIELNLELDETYRKQKGAEAKLEELKALYMATLSDLSKAQMDCETLAGRLEEANNEITQLRQTPELQAEYLRTVQKQLGRVFVDDEAYGFRNEFAIPGSICVMTEDAVIGGEKYVDACGRVVMDDQTTKEINMEKTMYGKQAIVINYILRYGAMSRIIQNLVQKGAVQFTLAYRESTSTYECFFNVKGKCFEDDAVIVFSDETGAAIHYPDTKEIDEKSEEGGA